MVACTTNMLLRENYGPTLDGNNNFHLQENHIFFQSNLPHKRHRLFKCQYILIYS